MQEPNRRQSVCVSWGSTEPVMPNQHSTSYMGSPQQQAAPRNAVLKELCALNPLHVNNAAPGKCQLRRSCFHEAAETSRTKPGQSGVYSGVFLGTGRRGNTQNSFSAMYLYYCFCSTLHSSRAHAWRVLQAQVQSSQGCALVLGARQQKGTGTQFLQRLPTPLRACTQSFDRGDKQVTSGSVHRFS